jgi:hypothetical protein
MKDYETMAESVLERRDKYVIEKRRRTRRIMSAASCFCLVALIGIGAWHYGKLSNYENTDTIGVTTDDTHDEGDISNSAKVEFAETEDDEIKSVEVEEDILMAGKADNGGDMDGDSAGYSIQKMISSFGETKMDGDISVNNGGVMFSDALTEAMEQYRDEVKYHVIVELFSDGVGLDCADWEGNAEMERIASLGYTVAFETYFDGYINHNYFTIHATCEELENFPANEQYGYCIMLYGERLDTSEETQDAIGGTSFTPGVYN